MRYGTPHFAQDLDAVVWPALHIVNLPMVESADAVRQAAAALEALERERGIARPLGILANIESPRGLRLAAEIALAHPRVIGLQIGYGDLFAPLGIASGEPAATQYVRTAVRMAAGEAGIDAFDGAYVNYSDQAGYRRDSEAARQLGFAGRSCIHPSQIAMTNEVFRPAEADIAHALRVVEAAQGPSRPRRRRVHRGRPPGRRAVHHPGRAPGRTGPAPGNDRLARMPGFHSFIFLVVAS